MAEMLLRLRAGPMLGLPPRWWLALVAAVGLSAVFAPAAIAVGALLWMQRDALGAALLKSVETVDVRGMAIGFLLIWPVLWMTSGGMAPSDDVLRHLTAWRHGFDYHQIYTALDPQFPHVSMWFGYEWLVGWLHRALGLQAAIVALQVGIYAAAAYSLWRVVQVLVPERSDAWLWRLLFISLLLLTQLMFRVTMARPEVVLAIWAMSAIWMRPAQWLAVGLLLQPLYWLAIVYAPAAVLLRASWRTRLICAGVAVAVGVAFWLGYAGLAWPRFLLQSHQWMGLRLGTVGENETIFLALALPSFLAALAVLLWRGRMQMARDWPVLALMAWFLLPGQIRYLSTVQALLLLLVARCVALPKLAARGQLVLWLVVLINSAMSVSATGGMGKNFERNLPHFATLPVGAQVLTAFDAATYLVPAEHPGIRSAPSMELGATSQAVQKQAVALGGKGKLDCEALRQAGFTHVIEQRLGSAAPCLELQEISNGWRLWRVR